MNTRSASAIAALIVLVACGDRIGLHQSVTNDGPTGTTVGGGEPPSLFTDASTPVIPYDGGTPLQPRGDGGYVPDTEPSSSTLQINPAHTGFMDDPTLAGPLVRLWSKAYASTPGYPVIARGLIVVARTEGNPPQSTVEAYRLRTGDLAWTATYSDPSRQNLVVGLAYDGGRVFVLATGGDLRAFDITTGAPLWTAGKLSQYAFSSAPVAYKGTLYFGGSGADGTVYALDESTGLVLHAAFVAGGADSSPAVSDEGVFVSYGCLQAYRFDLLSEALGWHHAGPCSGGGGATSVLANGFLFARDLPRQNGLLSASTGAELGSFAATTMPAFHGAGYFLQGITLSSRDASGMSTAWTFAGDNNLITPPIVVGGRVFVGSLTGMLFGVDEATGQATFSDQLAPFRALDEQHPATMAAAQGVIAIPAGNSLYVYGAPDSADAGGD